ncbi:MAG: hypothetical protein KGS00_03670 [Alphaproteobacteria bacterium]|nr:hypothetical protein [Alphaproteobacteria bacterium]
MDFKRSEIIAMAAAVIIPLIIFATVLTPGAVKAITLFLLTANNMPIVFGGAAAGVFCILAYRIYRRLRPRRPPKS